MCQERKSWILAPVTLEKQTFEEWFRWIGGILFLRKSYSAIYIYTHNWCWSQKQITAIPTSVDTLSCRKTKRLVLIWGSCSRLHLLQESKARKRAVRSLLYHCHDKNTIGLLLLHPLLFPQSCSQNHKKYSVLSEPELPFLVRSSSWFWNGRKLLLSLSPA